MAKIVLATEAPDDLNSVSLANAVLDEFPYETDDPTVLANAVSHPFLAVEFDAAGAEARYRETGVNPETDPLSASNPDSRIPFDADAVAEIEDAKVEDLEPVAIDAGLDQDKAKSSGGVAVTLAAFDPQNDKPVRNDATKAQTNANAGDVS